MEAAGVARSAPRCRCNERSLRDDAGRCLLLHVRTHERAVGVVVLEERDHRGRDREWLLGATSMYLTHRGDACRRAVEAHLDHLFDDLAFLVYEAAPCAMSLLLFFSGVEVDDLFGDFAVLTTLAYGVSIMPNSLSGQIARDAK
jgi:hypothetical protein